MVHRDFVMNLPWDYYQAIGEFIFRCSQLEMQMHEILWRAINIDNKQGRVLTIGAGAKTVRGYLSTITSENSKDRWLSRKDAIGRNLIQRIDSLVRRARDFSEFRNKIAHAAWQSPIGGKHEDVRMLFVKEQDEKILARVDPSIDAAYIHQQCAKVKTLNLEAKQLILDLWAHRGMPLSHLHGAKDVR